MLGREINLLPPARRQQLRNEAVVISLQKILKNINSSLLVLTLIAVGAGMTLTVLASIINRGEATELEAALADYQRLREVIVAQNTKYQYVAEVGSERLVWVDLLRQIIPTMPSGIRIEGLAGQVSHDEKGAVASANLIMRGGAATRTTMVLWQERLRELPVVQDIVSPTSNLLDRIDLTYDLTLVLTKTNDHE